MTEIVLSINLKKIKMTQSVNELLTKMARESEDIEICESKFDKPSEIVHYTPKNTMDIDSLRDSIIEEANTKRLNTISLDKNGNKKSLYKLRKTTIDTLSGIIQFKKEIIEELNSDIVKRLYWHATQEIEAHPEKYGDLLLATLYLNKNTPHVHITTSAIDRNGKPIANKKILYGRHTLSKLQTTFAENVNERVKADNDLKDITVKRGVNRVSEDNKE